MTQAVQLIDVEVQPPASGDRIIAFNLADQTQPGMSAMVREDGGIVGYSYSMREYAYTLYVTHWMPHPVFNID